MMFARDDWKQWAAKLLRSRARWHLREAGDGRSESEAGHEDEAPVDLRDDVSPSDLAAEMAQRDARGMVMMLARALLLEFIAVAIRESYRGPLRYSLWVPCSREDAHWIADQLSSEAQRR